MLLLRDIDPFNVTAWAERLAAMEASEEFEGRDFYIRQARDMIGYQRKAGLITGTPEKSPHSAPQVTSGPDAA
ncbi:hypothetical protein [Paracoccus jiaweipingae]|uniref:hypothetical protein n=1 Tax=Paracoccus sp. p2-l61 TaxID=3366950 RepID=UPI0037BAEC90